MMKNILLPVILTFGLGLGLVTNASAGFYDMDDVEQSFNDFKKSKTADQALNALYRMKNAVVDCLELTPPKFQNLKSNDVQIVAYRKNLEMLLDDVYSARQLMMDGRFDQAMKLSKKMEQEKKIGQAAFIENNTGIKKDRQSGL